MQMRNISAYLPVKSVPNVGINGGLCWAAAIASKYNYVNEYEKGDSGYVGAEAVYNVVRNDTGASPSWPLGTPRYIKRSLQLFGLSDTYVGENKTFSDSNAKRSAMNVTELYAELYWDNPVIISMEGDAGRHSVIICGVNCGTSYAVYTLIDSNFSNPVDVTVSYEAMNDGSKLVYANNGYAGKFTHWYETYSYKFSPGSRD